MSHTLHVCTETTFVRLAGKAQGGSLVAENWGLQLSGPSQPTSRHTSIHLLWVGENGLSCTGKHILGKHPAQGSVCGTEV